MGGSNRRNRKGQKKNSPKKNGIELLANELSQLKVTKKGSKAKRDEKELGLE